jgi:O-acetyl-ADP-ribose deacetylase (regulator of RNase III)
MQAFSEKDRTPAARAGGHHDRRPPAGQESNPYRRAGLERRGRKEAGTLASCYRECLKLAKKHDLRTVAFPSISTGAYGYPMEEAAKVALGTVRDFLENQEGVDKVIFILWGRAAFETYATGLEI